MDKNNDLCERLFEFAATVIEFLKTLPYSLKIKPFGNNYLKVHVPQEQIAKNRR
jgi:hypothetical protein